MLSSAPQSSSRSAFNNSYILFSLDREFATEYVLDPRQRVNEGLCLPSRLPSTAFMQREGDQTAPKTFSQQLRGSPTPHSESPVSEGPDSPQTLKRRLSQASGSSESSTSSVKANIERNKDTDASKSAWREPQPFEIFRAVERKDIVFLMEVRDRAFHLLLRRTGDATPLVHAMRIGQSHRDVAILLVGALSRFVNHLEDEDLQKSHNKTLLKALRVNLKIAIDYGLQQSQSDLIASFMQCLIMSEGDKWIFAQTSTIALALRAGTEGKPVQTAEQAVRKFTTRELGKARAIAALEDYIANATVDLLILAAWSSVLNVVETDPIPSYYFARDDRVYKAFLERLQTNKSAISRSVTKRLKWQLRLLERVIEGRTITYRRKVDILASELDEGDGV